MIKRVLLFTICLGIISYASAQISISHNQEVLVFVSPSTKSNVENIRSNLGIESIQLGNNPNIERWKIKPSQSNSNNSYEDADDFISFMKNQHPGVNIQLDYTYQQSVIPNDTSFVLQWGLNNNAQNTCQTGVDINAEKGWDIRHDASEMIVGVVDCGIDWSHPDLVNNIWQNLAEDADGSGSVLEYVNGRWILDPDDLDSIDTDGNGYIDDLIGWDFVNHDNNPYDDNGHGTHVSGIIGAEGNNQIGISGVAWKVQLMPLKALDSTGTGYSHTVIPALEYAIANGAKITNNSWGSPFFDSLLFLAMQNGRAHGHLAVAAAGNDLTNIDINPIYPAAFNLDHIISVGAHTCEGQATNYTNSGLRSVDIFAPGGDQINAIFSTLPNGAYGYKMGTSMAAPFVSGALALAWAEYPQSDFLDIRKRIIVASSPDSSLTGFSRRGSRLDLEKSLSASRFVIGEESQSRLFVSTKGLTSVTTEGDSIWLGTDGGGLILFNPQTNYKRTFRTNNSALKNNNIIDVWVDSKKRKWISSTNFLSQIKGDTSFLVSNLEMTQGFSQNISCNGFVEDSNQYVYFSHGFGISRFDGSSWTFFNRSLFNNRPLSCLEIDDNGVFWIGTFGGLVAWDGVTTVEYNTQTISTWPNNNVNSILADQHNNIWIGTSGGLVHLVNNQIDTVYTASNSSLQFSDIIDLKIDSSGIIWILSPGKSIYKIVNKNLVREAINPNTNFGFKDFAIDKYDKILIAGGGGQSSIVGGLICWDRINGKYYSFEDSFVTTNIWGRIEVDRFDNKWICASGGLHVINGQSWNIFNDNNVNPFPSQSALSPNDVAFEDSSVWVGLANAGVYNFRNGNWTHPLQNTNVFSIELDSTENLWVRPDSHLLVWNGTVFQQVNCPFSNLYSNVAGKSFSIDENDRLWIATNYDGLISYDPNNSSWKAFNSDSIPTWPQGNDRIQSVLIDDSSFVWVGTDDGLIRINPQTDSFHLVDLSSFGIPINTPMMVTAQDSNGVHWIGSRYGLLKYDGGKGTLFSHELMGISEGFPINHLAIDAKGRKWISSLGLIVFEDELKASFSAERLITCQGDSIKFFLTSTAGDSLHWLYNDSLIYRNDSSFSFLFPEVGSHKITLVVFQDGVDSFSQYIQVLGPIEVNLPPDSTACAQAVFFNPDLYGETFLWTNHLNDTLGTRKAFIADSSGTFILKATDACGASSQDTITVTLTGNGSCVWPGDTQTDGIVNMEDFLFLAGSNLDTGSVRQNASIQFQSQPAADWVQFKDSINLKHSDCDGNGQIDIAIDKQAILQNRNTSFIGLQSPNGEYYMRVRPDFQTYSIGDTMWFDVILDHQSGTGREINGIAFSLDVNIFPQKSPIIELDTSWLGVPVDLDTLVLTYQNERKLDFGLVRKDKRGQNGRGKLMRAGIIVSIDDIDNPFRNTSLRHFNFTCNNVLLQDSLGNFFPINSAGSQTTETTTFEIPWVRMQLKAWLSGADRGANMSTELRQQELLPLTPPYEGFENFKVDSIPPGVVDWVWVELRHKNDSLPSGIAGKRPAWLQEDGQIIDPIANDNSLWISTRPGEYYVIVHHRNHLPIMSSMPIQLSDKSIVFYDFTTSSSSAFGYSPLAESPMGTWSLKGGNYSSNTHIQLSDIELFWKAQNGLQGYHNSDGNLDGLVDETDLILWRKYIFSSSQIPD